MKSEKPRPKDRVIIKKRTLIKTQEFHIQPPGSVRRLTTEADIAIIKGMLARGDKQSDITAYWGSNSGRIAETNTGRRYPHVEAAPLHELPPPGPYLVNVVPVEVAPAPQQQRKRRGQAAVLRGKAVEVGNRTAELDCVYDIKINGAIPSVIAPSPTTVREIELLQRQLDDRDITIRDLRARLDIATAQVSEALQQARLLADQHARFNAKKDLPLKAAGSETRLPGGAIR